jgi:hypothetical protein
LRKRFSEDLAGVKEEGYPDIRECIEFLGGMIELIGLRVAEGVVCLQIAGA